MMRIHAIVAARMTSTRLPGKVMMDLAGKPAIVRLIERLRHSKYIDQIVIATTVNKSDDILVQMAVEQGVLYYRGSEEDVLLRTLEAAESTQAELIVQVTSDCPLIDAETVDLVIQRFLDHPYLDYATNQVFLTYPLGFGVEVFRTSTLREIEIITDDPADREHVSLYYYENPEKYHLSNIEAPFYLRHPDYRLTLDTMEDYQLIQKLYSELYPLNPNFNLYDIIKKLTDQPDWLNMNRNIAQKSIR